MLLWWDGFRQHFPAQHFAYVRGDVWALARRGTTRTCLTNMARSGVVVARHRASWERFLAESHGDRRGVRQTLVARRLQQLGSRLYLWDALWAAVDTTLVPKVGGPMPGVQKWPDHSGDPARGASRVGHPWALIGVVSAWGVGYLGWPVWARLLPGQRTPRGVVAGPAGVPRVDCWAVVVALVRALRPYGGTQPWRVVADADVRQASFLKPLVAEGSMVISRLRKAAVGGDDPVPVVGNRPRGRPRQQGRGWQLAPVLPGEPITALTVRLYGQAAHLQVVWRDGWLRAVTHKVRVVVVATKHEPILLVSTDRTLPPAAIIQLYAARVPLELTLRDLQQYGGRGDYQGDTLWAIHRLVPLALTACCLWRLTLRQDQQAPWLTTATASPAGELRPLSCQRLHRALRRFVLRRIFAASAPGAHCPNTEVSDEPIFRIAA
jgi:hypothetical protein